MARASMRSKIAVLEEALAGHFDDHHAFRAKMMLERIDAITSSIEHVGEQVAEVIDPFGPHVERLDEITGVGLVAAQELIAELGVDMSAFPTAGRRCARCPGPAGEPCWPPPATMRRYGCGTPPPAPHQGPPGRNRGQCALRIARRFAGHRDIRRGHSPGCPAGC